MSIQKIQTLANEARSLEDSIATLHTLLRFAPESNTVILGVISDKKTSLAAIKMAIKHLANNFKDE